MSWLFVAVAVLGAFAVLWLLRGRSAGVTPAASSSAPSQPSAVPAPDFADAMLEGGFFAHNPSAASCRDRIAVDAASLWACDSGRLFHADAEGLAEGFALTFLKEEVGPLLNKLGCPVEGAADSPESDTYAIEIDGRHYPILDDRESDESWTEASDNVLALLNDLLKRAGSAERAFGLYGGEDLHVVFLSLELYARIRSEPTIIDREKPWERASDAR